MLRRAGTIIDVSKLNLSQNTPDGIIKISDGSIWDSIIANLGYGIFCSTIVAALVDCGATKRQRENDKKEFAVTTQFLKNSIKSLIEIRTMFDQLHKEDVSDNSFAKWSEFISALCLLGEESIKSKAIIYIKNIMLMLF